MIETSGKKKFKLGTLNCQSVRNKLNVVIQHIKNNHIDMCFLQETFLRKDDGAHLNEIREQGLKVHSVPRTDGREHGGIAVVYLPNIKLKPLKLSKMNSIIKHFNILNQFLSQTWV